MRRWKPEVLLFGGVSVRRRFKIAFVLLLVVTILWMVALHPHVIDYNQMIKEEGIVNMWLEKPYWAYKYGSVLVVSGFIIFVACELLLEGVYKDWRKDKAAKNEKVGWAVKILKVLASLAIFAFFLLILVCAPLIF